MKKFLFLPVCILFAGTLFAQPVIRSFAPLAGEAGSIVTIIGKGFDKNPANDIVYFGTVKAPILSATDTTIIVTVPVTATYQPISVTSNHLTCYSIIPFNLLFSGGNTAFDNNSFLPKSDIFSGIYPHAVTLGDFDGDGKLEVLVSKGSSGAVTIFRNTSSGNNISFDGRLEFAATGNSHENAAIADLDGDGKLDFVTANTWGTSSVSVFRNTSTPGSISFAANIDYPADNAPYSVAIGDLDGDGKPDLAIPNGGGNTITLYRNTSTPGNISFTSRADIAAGTSPFSIVIADFDADGKPELAVTTQGSTSALSVFKNTSVTGTISFDSPVICASLNGSFTVATGDLDGDGYPDLAAANAAGNVAVVRNTSSAGNVSFGAQQSFTTGYYTVAVTISDINGDNKPDLITANRFDNSVSAFRNTSSSGNINFDSKIDYAVNTAPLIVAAGDLNGDGRPDLVTANSSVDMISVLKNMIGTNTAPGINSFTPTAGIAGTIVKIKGINFTGADTVKFGGIPAASFNVDSATGITATVAGGASGEVSITTPFGTASLAGFVFNGPIIHSFSPAIGVTGSVVNIIGENFTAATTVKFGGVSATSFIVNSSTSITAIVGLGASGSVTVTTANGTATMAGFSFGPPAITSISPVAGAVGTLVTVSGENFNPIPAQNTVFFGAVKATVLTATTNQLQVTVPAGSLYQPISVTNNNLTAYSPKPFLSVFDGNNTPLNANSFSIAASYGTGSYPTAVTISDLNGDGTPDLVIANNLSNSISLLKNASKPGIVSFSTKTDYGTGPVPKGIAIGDLDGDGKPDIAVVNFNSGNASTMSVFRNTSTGSNITLDAKIDYPTGNGSLGITMNDMDGDGKPDIIVTSGNSGFFSFFKNTSTATGLISFATKVDYPALNHSDQIISADLDEDGKPDLITSNFSSNNISVYRNTSNAGVFSLGPNIDYPCGSNPSFIKTGDLDGDGKIDLLITNYSSGTVSIYKNFSVNGTISLGTKQDFIMNATNIAPGDLNGNGKIDLCTGVGLTGIISVLENGSTGIGNFGLFPKIDFTTGTYDTFTAIADIDGDGKPDLVAINTIPASVTILRNKTNDPQITSLSATTAVKGDSITINGTNLVGVTAVTFGGTDAASFNVISPSAIKATVGAGASGPVTVVTASGAGAIAAFNFIPEISAGDTTTFCGGKFVDLSSTAASGNQWYKDAVALAGETQPVLRVKASGNYTVKTTSNGIITSSTKGIAVNVIAIPTPVINNDAQNVLHSSATSGNQWHVGNTLIPGATGQTYHPTQNGNYSVTSTVDNCTSDMSAPYQYLTTGLINLGNNQFIKLYPNPVVNNLYINWQINGYVELNIEICDLQGRSILLNRNIQNSKKIDLSGYPAGTYFLRLFTRDNVKINQSIKITKVN